MSEASKEDAPRNMISVGLNVQVGDNFETHLHYFEDFEDEAYVVFVAEEGDDIYEGEYEGQEQIDLPAGFLKAVRAAKEEDLNELADRWELQLPPGLMEALRAPYIIE